MEDAAHKRLPAFTLRQLEVFVTVVQTGGLSQAAKQLVLSEPAVSGQIKELERLFGCRLLDRAKGRRGVTLTAAGQPVFAACERAFAALHEGATEVESMLSPVRKSSRLGVTPGFGAHALPQLYTEFQRIHPDVDVRVSLGRRAEIQEGLVSGELELGVFSDPVDDERLVSTPLSPYDLLLVGPLGHRLAAESAVPFNELATERLIVTHQHSAPMEAIAHLAAERGVSLQAPLEIDDSDTLIQAVAYGLGISALSRSRLEVAQRVAEGRLAILDVEGFPIQCEWHLGQARRPLGHGAELLRRYLLHAHRK